MDWVSRVSFEEDQLLNVLQWIAWIWVGILICFLAGFFLFRHDESEWRAQVPEEPNMQHFAYEKIGSGPFALNGAGLSPLFAALSHEILCLGRNTRPDARPQEAEMALCLCSSGERRQVRSGVPIFLDLQMNESGDLKRVQFANGTSQVWVMPHPLDPESVLFEVGECPLFSEVKKRQFTQKIACPNGEKKENVAFAALAAARFLGRDRFFEQYGGETYRALAQKEKIELVGPGASYALFVQEGDLLSWKDGKWFLGADSSAPLAAVKQIAAGEIVLQAWDETGFESEQVKVFRKRIEPSLQRMEKFLSAVRMRTATQVSALLEGKRVILKQGDWLIKSKNGWKNLRSIRDIEAYLNHALIGQLFVFDAIEGAIEGNPVVRGNLFDESRTLVEPVVIAINPERTQQKGKRRHKK